MWGYPVLLLLCLFIYIYIEHTYIYTFINSNDFYPIDGSFLQVILPYFLAASPEVSLLELHTVTATQSHWISASHLHVAVSGNRLYHGILPI